MTHRLTTSSLLALAAAASLGLTACSGGDSEGESSSSTTSAASSEAGASSDAASDAPSEESSAPAESSESSEATESSAPADDASSETSSDPASDPSSASSADPSADPSGSADPSAEATGGPAEGALSPEEKALSEDLKKLALLPADVPGGSGQGESQYIPQAQGEPLHLTLTGLEATGECKKAIDALNAGERRPDGSYFSVAPLKSGAQAQVGVVTMDDVKTVGQDVASVATSCKTVKGDGGTGTFTALPDDNGFLVGIKGPTGEGGQFGMAVQPVNDTLAAVTMVTDQSGDLDPADVSKILDAQAQKAKG